jgi:hypothetical protein
VPRKRLIACSLEYANFFLNYSEALGSRRAGEGRRPCHHAGITVPSPREAPRPSNTRMRRRWHRGGVGQWEEFRRVRKEAVRKGDRFSGRGREKRKVIKKENVGKSQAAHVALQICRSASRRRPPQPPPPVPSPMTKEKARADGRGGQGRGKDRGLGEGSRLPPVAFPSLF